MPNPTKEDPQKKLLRLARIRTAAAILTFALIAAMGYFLYDTRVQLGAALTSTEETLAALTEVSSGLKAADIPAIAENVNTLVEDGQDVAATAADGLNQALQKLQQLDIETLNKAIADLADAIGPLARLLA